MSWRSPAGGERNFSTGDGKGANNRPAAIGSYRDYLLARNSNSVFTGYLTGSGEPSAPSLSLGERVVWLQDEGAAELGSVRWIGRLPSLAPKDWSVGIEFDRPIGDGNGRFAGKQYFIARNGHALFLPIMTLMKAEEFFGGHRNDTKSFEPRVYPTPPGAPRLQMGFLPSTHETKKNFNLDHPGCEAGGSTAFPCPVHTHRASPLPDGHCFVTSTPRGHHKSVTIRETVRGHGGHRLEDWSDDDFPFQSWKSSQSVVSCPAALGPRTILMEVSTDSSDSDRDKGKFRTLMSCFLPGTVHRKKKKKKQRKRKKFVLAQQQKQFSYVSSMEGGPLRSSESCSTFASNPCHIHSCQTPAPPMRNKSWNGLDNFTNNNSPLVRCGCSTTTNSTNKNVTKLAFSTAKVPDSPTQVKKKKAPPPPRPVSPFAPRPVSPFAPTLGTQKSFVARSSPLLSPGTTSFNSLPLRNSIAKPVTGSTKTLTTSSPFAPPTAPPPTFKSLNTLPMKETPTKSEAKYTGNLVLIGNQRPISRLNYSQSLNITKDQKQKSEFDMLPVSPRPRQRTAKKKAPMPPTDSQDSEVKTSEAKSNQMAIPAFTFTSPETAKREFVLLKECVSLDVSTDDDRVDSPSRPALPKKTISHDSLALFGYYPNDSLKKSDLEEMKKAKEDGNHDNANEAGSSTARQTPQKEVVKEKPLFSVEDTKLNIQVTEKPKRRSVSPKATPKENKECQTLDTATTVVVKDEKPTTSKCEAKVQDLEQKNKDIVETKSKKKSKKDKKEAFCKEQNQVKEILTEIEQVVKSKPSVKDFVTAFTKFTEKAEKIAADYNTETANLNPKPKPEPPKKIPAKVILKPAIKEEPSALSLKSHSTKWTFNQSQLDRKMNISFAEADQIIKENELKTEKTDSVEMEDKITNKKRSLKKYAAPPAPALEEASPSPKGSPKLNNLDAEPSTSGRSASGVSRPAGAESGAPFSQTRVALRQLASFQRQHRRALSVGDLTQDDPSNGRPYLRPKTPEVQRRVNGTSGQQCKGKPPLPLRALELAGGSPALFLELEEAISRGEHKRAAALARELALHKVVQSRPRRNAPLHRKPAEEPVVTVNLYVEDKDTHQGPIPLTVYPSMPVSVLKEKVERELGFASRCQRWILGKTFVVDEQRTLVSLNVITPGCPIFLYIVQPRNQDEEDVEELGAAAMEPRSPHLSPVRSPHLSPVRSPPRSPLHGHVEPHLETLLEEAAELSVSLPTGDGDTSSENTSAAAEVMSAGSFEVAELSQSETEEDFEFQEVRLPTTDPSQESSTEDSPDERPLSATPRLSYNQLVALEDQDLIANAEPFECPICFVLVEHGQGVVLRDCLHLFCRDCLSRSVEYCEEAVLKCPFRNDDYSCDSHLLEREIKALVSPAMFEKHLQRSMSAAESKAENSFHCKSADCPGWCLFEDNVNVFACPVCACVNCLTCAAIHEGKDCRQYQDELEYESAESEDARKTKEYLDTMVSEGKAMRCPTCRVIVMKKWGCDWLKCSVCQTEICWVTKGARWGPGGRGDTSGGCKCMINKVRCHPQCNYCH